MKDAIPLPVVVLISGGGSNLQSIINAVEITEIDAEIRAVISNRPDAYGLQRARKHGITCEVIDHTQYPDRLTFEQRLHETLISLNAELVLMAGFMRILSEGFINHYQGRLLNIHPSLLPEFRGLHTHARAIEAGVKSHGCSVHFATSDLDSGPVIIQASVPVYDSDTEQTLAARVLEKEHIIYPLAVKWFCNGRLRLSENSIQLDGKTMVKPLQLNELSRDMT